MNFWKCTLFARSNVHDLQDKDLLGAGDTIALEAKYNPWHLVSLYNKAPALQIEDKHDKVTSWAIRSIVLPELLEYIDESRMDEDVASIFKLSN